jgi:hypothetical protein
VGAGKTLYIGSFNRLDWHLHGAPVFIADLTSKFRLRLPSEEWLVCRFAVVPAGVRHELDLDGGTSSPSASAVLG